MAVPDQEFEKLRVIPPLGILAAAAAVVDLGLNRWLVRSLNELLSHATLIQLVKWGEVPRNLAAVTGLVALTVALLAFLRTSRFASVIRRLSIAGFAGIFLPTTALAAFLPAERTTVQIVLFGTGAANVLGILLGLTAGQRRAPAGIRAGVLMATIAVFLSFCALVFAIVPALAGSSFGHQTSSTLRAAGEIAFLLSPLAVAATVLAPGRDRALHSQITAAVVAAAVALAFFWLEDELHADFSTVMYGAFRLDLLLEAAPLLYLVPLCIGFGVGVGALVSPRPEDRQAGVGLLLLLAAGYAPQSPGRLMMMVLGMALLSRACLALGKAGARKGTPDQAWNTPSLAELDRSLEEPTDDAEQ